MAANLTQWCLHNTTYYDSNPDISGVGVRVSFYLQTFLLVLLTDRSWQDAPIALWTFIATSAGLTLAAIVQRSQLSLFEALQVSNLVWLANFGTFFALASYSRHKKKSDKDAKTKRGYDYKVKFGAMTQTLVSMALTLYVWTNASTFGLDSECSPLLDYMIFVVKVSAVGIGRTVGLVITSILALTYVLITLRELHSYRQSHREKVNKKRKLEKTDSLPTHAPSISITIVEPPSPSRSSISIHPLPSLHLASTATSSLTDRHDSRHSDQLNVPSVPQTPHTPRRGKRGKRRPKRRRWSSDVDPMLVGIIICQAIIFTYFIVSTELLLQQNSSDDPSAREWSFGQILALIVVIPSALSVANALNEHGVKRLGKRKRTGMNDERRRNRRQNNDMV